MPSTQEKQVRTGALAQQWVPARGEDQQAEQAAGASDSLEVAELRRRYQAMEGALQDVLVLGEMGDTLTQLMQTRGHGEVVGMINSGSQLAPVSK